MKIATWNINSVRLRIDLVLKFLEREAPDALCLQEIKCTNDQFPAKALKLAGYAHQAVSGQPGYHGVAIVSKLPLKDAKAEPFAARTTAVISRRHCPAASGSTISTFRRAAIFLIRTKMRNSRISLNF